TFLLMRYRKSDINSRGAFLHMAADTLVSVGVVVSGIVISLTGWSVIDPIIGLVIAVIILVGTWDLLSESLRMSLDAVPEGIDPDEVLQKMENTPGVDSVHHLHIWPISTTDTALTAHLLLESDARSEEVVRAVKQTLREAGIHHATLETEPAGQECADPSCI
ncbi:MAG: cation transporter, partial [Bacteroidales bacterium]|nr:cation transporter [Bacteroidales bacterium]